MNVVELLRFNWKPSVIRLAVAAWHHPGPVPKRVWVVRAGLPANHFNPTLEEARRLGLLAVEASSDGLRLFVQPVAFWSERPLAGVEMFEQAWAGMARQERLRIVTESMSMAEGLAVNIEADGAPHRNPEPPPDSGEAAPCRTMENHVPEHGLNMDHGRGNRIPVGKLPLPKATPHPGERDAMDAMALVVEHLFPVVSEAHRQHWERRIGEDAALVQYAIEEALLPRRQDGGRMAPAANLAAFANRVYLKNIGKRRVRV